MCSSSSICTVLFDTLCVSVCVHGDGRGEREGLDQVLTCAVTLLTTLCDFRLVPPHPCVSLKIYYLDLLPLPARRTRPDSRLYLVRLPLYAFLRRCSGGPARGASGDREPQGSGRSWCWTVLPTHAYTITVSLLPVHKYAGMCTPPPTRFTSELMHGHWSDERRQFTRSTPRPPSFHFGGAARGRQRAKPRRIGARAPGRPDASIHL